MTILQVSEILTSIRDGYAGIVRMCETFNVESQPENYSEYVLKRATVLSDIEHNHNILSSEVDDWTELCRIDTTLARISNEIQTFISTIIALDETIKARLSRKMGEVKRELGGMGKRTKATLAYARH